jgi:hypothetical protein
MHEVCNLYCHGTEHALLVTGYPETTFEQFEVYALSFQGILREAKPVLEIDITTFEPQWNFDVNTQQYTFISTLPVGVIVWRLRIDFAHVTQWPPYPKSVVSAPRKQRWMTRAWAWWTQRQSPA